VSATRAAMEEGIVPGGGMALFNATSTLHSSSNEVQDVAVKILIKAMQSPVAEIIKNSGQEPKSVISKFDSKDIWTGFNAVTNKVEDLKKAGIIDPLKVTKTAFTNAVSVASTYLMMGVAMTEVPKKDEGSSMSAGMGGGMMGM
jgi:chaperonin GroEL